MLPRIAAMVLNQHHLIAPTAAEAVLSALDGRIGVIEVDADVEPVQFGGNAFIGGDRVMAGRHVAYVRTKKGAAVVPVHGELVNRGAWVGAWSGMTSYEGLQHALRLAAADEQVRSIVLDVDSPGGMVAGAFETAALIRAVGQTKPVTAVANSLMASAAYLISSGASQIVASDTAQVGSIGVLFVHVDRSGEMAQKGRRVTLIHAGKHKIDGHPFGALPEQVRLDIQARGNAIYAKFVDAVVAGRAQLKSEDVRATEARVFAADEAKSVGLVDGVATFDQAVADAEAGKVGIRKASRTTPQPGQKPAPQNDNTPAKEAARMQDDQDQPAATDAGEITEGLSQAQIEHITSAMIAALGEAVQPAASKPQDQPAATTQAQHQAPVETADAAVARGRTEERARIAGILGHAEAKERPVQARVLALESDVSVDQAASMLAKMPTEKSGASAAASFYAAVAANGGNPKVKLEGERDGGQKAGGGLLQANMSKMLAAEQPRKTAPAPR